MKKVEIFCSVAFVLDREMGTDCCSALFIDCLHWGGVGLGRDINIFVGNIFFNGDFVTTDIKYICYPLCKPLLSTIASFSTDSVYIAITGRERLIRTQLI